MRAPDEGNVELVEELESHAIVRNITGGPSETIQFTVASVDCAPEVNEALLSLDAVELARWSPGHGYAPQGAEGLRNQVASYLDGLGLPTSPGQVLITSGATQAIMLASRLYLEPRSIAVVEAPSYGGRLTFCTRPGRACSRSSWTTRGRALTSWLTSSSAWSLDWSTSSRISTTPRGS